MTRRNSPLALLKPAASRLVLLFALFAFVTQGYLVQTHLHGVPATAQQLVTHVAPPDAPRPADPYNPATCPLCQEILHAGAYITPDIITLPLQLDWIVFCAPVLVLPLASAQRMLGWRSRAPPRA